MLALPSCLIITGSWFWFIYFSTILGFCWPKAKACTRNVVLNVHLSKSVKRDEEHENNKYNVRCGAYTPFITIRFKIACPHQSTAQFWDRMPHQTPNEKRIKYTYNFLCAHRKFNQVQDVLYLCLYTCARCMFVCVLRQRNKRKHSADQYYMARKWIENV